MNADMKVNRYVLEVNVVDRVRNENAVGTVTVVIHEVPDYGFQNQVCRT